MNTVTIVGPATVLTSYCPEGRVLDQAGVAMEDDRIIGVNSFEHLQAEYPRADLLDARGGLILPGLINLHHHFYSALARGLDPGRPMTDFDAILGGLWWRLDRALDADTVRLSAALSLAECLRWGCTTVFDHHASPAFISGSLECIADEVRAAGIRAVLCYEVSDRNGHDEAMRGLEENLEFARANRRDPQLRGLLGLHASFTLTDETLKSAAGMRPQDLSIHIHLAEAGSDVDHSLERFGSRPLERLDRTGLLDRNALLIHGVHLEPEEFEAVAARGSTLVHNPESNANNAVGRLDLDRAAAAGCAVGLGTDGMSSNVLRSLRAAFLAQRAGTGDPSGGFETIPALLETNVRRAAQAFNEPLLGRLDPGAPADVVVLDDPLPTPMTADNAFGHLLYGASEHIVRHTVARGRVLFRDFRHTMIDAAGLAEAAREAVPALWERFRGLE